MTQRVYRPQNSVGQLQSTPPFGPTSAPPTSSPSYFPSQRTTQPARSTTNPEETMRHPASASGHTRSHSNTLPHDPFSPPFKSHSAHGHQPQDPFPSSRQPDDDHAPLRSPNPPFASSSRPSSPKSPSHSDDLHPAYRIQLSRDNVHASSTSASGHSSHSFTSANSSTTAYNTPSSGLASASSLCSSCRLPMSGQFVRALGAMYHLDCFRCQDCNTVVASKFFPIEGPEGRQQPLCERDYFGRLSLLCGKCGMALRGSYITACNKKFHVEHFTCSVCPTLFGPQDSYYEHQNDVYCHYHYSTRFATKCVGCNSAILKQFVEINRNSRDECWHPECYMIHKFWNVKVASRPLSLSPSADDAPYAPEEAEQTPASLKEGQARMEQKVYRIWTNLSSFEESSAACISEMLRHVSNGLYLEAIRMAEKFILHVEVLFAAIDELETGFARAGAKGMSHIREARMLCRKTVDLFTLLSHTQDPNNASPNNNRMGMTQELLALVTGLAHYLKILIRIALTGALKLEREHNNPDGLTAFLDHLHCLALDGGDPQARRVRGGASARVINDSSTSLGVSVVSGTTAVSMNTVGKDGLAYGYKSLSPENAGDSPFSPTAIAALNSGVSMTPPSDLCISCRLTVEEDCVRLGTYQRWHSQCVKCITCGKVAAVSSTSSGGKNTEGDLERSKTKDGGASAPVKLSSARRPPANVEEFCYHTTTSEIAYHNPSASVASGDPTRLNDSQITISCTAHAHPEFQQGFIAVARLEQYAFLLNVALRRLFLLLRKRGVMPLSSSVPITADSQERNPYRDSSDIMRMKQVHLDRKLSATARLPKRSTIVESPTGKIAHPSDVIAQQRAHPMHQPQLHGPDSSHQAQRAPYATPIIGAPSKSARSNPPPRPAPPSAGLSPGHLEQLPAPIAPSPQSTPPSETHIIRPPFARNNTQVFIVDDRPPDLPLDGSQGNIDPSNSPMYGDGPLTTDPQASYPEDEGLTLGDIPQLLESEQAREQHRSLPRQSGRPLIAELTPLELLIAKHAAVLALQRSPLKDHFELDDILEMVEAKKATFWNKIFSKDKDKKNFKKKGVFGVPLELLVEREGADSMLGVSRSTLRVPSFVDDVVSAMKQMDMSIEGIFRKNGNIRRLKELTDAIDRDPASVDLTSENPVQLAALLKKFLRDLPDPLLTFKLHKLWNSAIALPNESDRRRCLHILSLILPKYHRDTLEVLFVFLKWVASFAHVDEETGSKMDLQNLATVICPSILYAKGRDAAREDSFTAIPVVTQLLEEQDEFYAVPEEFLPILHDQDYFVNCMDMPAKDVLKKVDTYTRLKHHGRTQNGVTGGMAVQHPPTQNGARHDTPDGRLTSQRSDPALSRGRSPIPGNEGLRNPPPLRFQNQSRSRERQFQQGNSDGSARFPSHPGLTHQPFSSGPPSPRQQQKMDPQWPVSPRQGPVGGRSGQGATSRPSSIVPGNMDNFTPNGRHSPGRY